MAGAATSSPRKPWKAPATPGRSPGSPRRGAPHRIALAAAAVGRVRRGPGLARIATGAFREDEQVAEPPARRLSVAVLPFDALGAAPPETDYFSRGISDDIAAALGRFPELAVAAPLAVARQRTAGASAEDLQRQLKLRYLVEGQRARARPTASASPSRLTDLPQGVLLWSETYDAAPGKSSRSSTTSRRASPVRCR